MSTESDRLQEVYAAYKLAMSMRSKDLRDAKTNADVDRILGNIDSLKADYLQAARTALDKSGPAVEAAYQTAKSAKAAIDKALKDGKALPERIRAMTKLAEAVGRLIALAD